MRARKKAKLKIHTHFGIEGFFDFYMHDPTTGISRSVKNVKNLITNSALNAFGASSIDYNSICVGTGTSAPANSDTKLQSLVAIAAATRAQVSSGTTPYWKGITLTTQFGQGVAAGNIAEVGVGSNSNTSTYILRSRARIVDSEGNPTIITVLPTEFLTVVYTLRVYPSTPDVTGIVDGYSFVLRPANIQENSAGLSNNVGFNSTLNGYTGCEVSVNPIADITSNPSGLSSATAFDAGTYVTGSYTLTRVAKFSLATANLSGGIKSLRWWFIIGISWQVEFTPNILKDNTKLLDITCTQSWGRL